MAGWDDDEEDDEQGEDFELAPADWDSWDIPQSWDDWWDFDWESYDGDYEEYALSADY